MGRGFLLRRLFRHLLCLSPVIHFRSSLPFFVSRRATKRNTCIVRVGRRNYLSNKVNGRIPTSTVLYGSFPRFNLVIVRASRRRVRLFFQVFRYRFVRVRIFHLTRVAPKDHGHGRWVFLQGEVRASEDPMGVLRVRAKYFNTWDDPFYPHTMFLRLPRRVGIIRFQVRRDRRFIRLPNVIEVIGVVLCRCSKDFFVQVFLSNNDDFLTRRVICVHRTQDRVHFLSQTIRIFPILLVRLASRINLLLRWEDRFFSCHKGAIVSPPSFSAWRNKVVDISNSHRLLSLFRVDHGPVRFVDGRGHRFPRVSLFLFSRGFPQLPTDCNVCGLCVFVFRGNVWNLVLRVN